MTRDADLTLPTDGDLQPTMVVRPDAYAGSNSSSPRTFGHYRIVRVLGEGGMGTVYEAEQDQPRRRVGVCLDSVRRPQPDPADALHGVADRRRD